MDTIQTIDVNRTDPDSTINMHRIGSGNWEGRASTTWYGSIKDLRKKIPTFTSLAFQVGEAVNVYKSLIVREPLGGVDLGDVNGHEVGGGMPDPMNSQRMPIDVVSTNYGGALFMGQRQGYKLIQHHYILDEVFEALKKFKPNPDNTIGMVSLDATLKISVYGARIKIQFLVPHYKRDSYILKVTCFNSVDKSIALIIELSLHQQVYEDDLFGTGHEDIESKFSDVPYKNDLPFAGFHHVHTQDLEDSAIRNFLERELQRFLYGTWDEDPIPIPDLQDLSDGILTAEEREQLQELIDGEERALTLLEVHRLLVSLACAVENLGLKEKQRVRFIKLLKELHELVDKKEKDENGLVEPGSLF